MNRQQFEQSVNTALQHTVPAIGDWCPSKDLYEKFLAYAELLQRWDRKIRLTGLEDLRTFTERHLYDSLIAAGDVLSLPPDAKLLDVGAGAGFPGIPLALLRPELHWTLTESRQRRAAFLRHLRHSLSLPNLHVEVVRVAGDPIREKLGEDYDRLTFRAVAPEQILPVAHRYLMPTGRVLYWGTAQYEAPTTLSSLNAPTSQPYTLPQGEEFSLLTFVRKPTQVDSSDTAV